MNLAAADLSMPLTALLLSDGRPGHFNLAEGILAAAQTMRPVEVTRINVTRGHWPGALLAAWSNSGLSAKSLLHSVYGIDPAKLPRAALVVSAGGETLAANVACARLLGASNVFYGSLRRFAPESFDLVLTSYDAQARRPRHVFALKPSPAAIRARGLRTTTANRPPRTIAMLIGGPSGESQFDGRDWDQLLSLIQGATASGLSWQLTNSRRTPDAVSDRLAAMPGLAFTDVRRPGGQGLADILAASDAVVVTDDSSSMVSDAVAAGLPVIGLAPARHAPTANEQGYRETLGRNGWYRSLPLATIDAARMLATFSSLTPLVSDPGVVLAELLAARLPKLFKPQP